jgi:hypothetical protein
VWTKISSVTPETDGITNGAATIVDKNGNGNGKKAGSGEVTNGNKAAAEGSAIESNGHATNGNGKHAASHSSSASYISLTPGRPVALPTELGSYPHLVRWVWVWVWLWMWMWVWVCMRVWEGG